MEDVNVIVYVKTDENSLILEVGSSIYLTNTDAWKKIDAGNGDRYTHAQRGYFPNPVLTKDNIPRYKLVDGKPIERTEKEIQEDRDRKNIV